MLSKKEREKIGREKLQQIIEMCTAIESRSLDPFLLNVDDIINVIRECFSQWENPEDLCLDAETIHHLASVIKLQGEWVKSHSTSLYTDPFLLEEKLTSIEKEEIVEIFLKAWHPIVEFEQISIHSLKESILYWDTLLPLTERWKEFSTQEVTTSYLTKEELIIQRILRDTAFSQELENFWHELKKKVKEKNEKEKLSYWDFVGAETYGETVQRAFLTSFLITYGYAKLDIYPLEETIFIRPEKKPVTKTSKKQLISMPISVSYENWQKWRRDELE